MESNPRRFFYHILFAYLRIYLTSISPSFPFLLVFARLTTFLYFKESIPNSFTLFQLILELISTAQEMMSILF